MSDSSDKEEEERARNGGGASPRTLLAIQQALAEDEDPFVEQPVVISSSGIAPTSVRHPVPRVVLSSSDEEPEPGAVKTLPQENLNLKWNQGKQSVPVRDVLLDSSSEDETDEAIGQRNGDRHLALLQPAQERGVESRDESNKGGSSEDVRGTQTQNQDPEVTFSGPICSQLGGVGAVTFEQRSPRSTEAPEKTDVISEASEESESEGTLISVYTTTQVKS